MSLKEELVQLKDVHRLSGSLNVPDVGWVKGSAVNTDPFHNTLLPARRPL